MASEWRETTWGEEVSLEYGKAIRGYQEAKGKFRVFGSNGPVGWTDNGLADGPGVILGRKGAYRGVQFSREPFWVIDTAYFVVPKTELDMRWLYYAIKHYKLGEIDDGSPIPSTTRAAVYAQELMVPPLEEQLAIADTLGTLDDRIDNLRQTNATLEAIAQALFKSWFVDFDPVRAKAEGREPEGMDATTAALFPSEFEDSELGPIPKGWSTATVGDCAAVIDCLHAKKPELLDVGRPYLQLNCIRNDGLLDTIMAGRISEADYEKWISRIEAGPGDCVITNVGRVGAVAQIPDGFKAAIGRNMTGIRPKSHFSPTFLVQLLMSDHMRREIDLKTDAGTILSALNVKSIPKLRFVCPSKGVLERFEEVGRPLRSGMEANLRRSNLLGELRDTLLPRLISGKLRLPEAQAMLKEAIA